MILLNVPYDQKDLAKRHGAKWDHDLKKWYLDSDTVPEALKDFVPFEPWTKENFKGAWCDACNFPHCTNWNAVCIFRTASACRQKKYHQPE